MDDRSTFRVLPADEFMQLSTDEKLAYLDEAIRILLGPRSGKSLSEASGSQGPTDTREA